MAQIGHYRVLGMVWFFEKDFDRIIAFPEHGMVISTQVVILAPILFKCTWSAIMAAGVTPEILDA